MRCRLRTCWRPAGTARIGSIDYNIMTNASPQVVDQFRDMPIKVVRGVPVLLGDVAKVGDGFAEQTNIVHVNGKRATYLTILKHSDASSLEVVDATRALLPEIRKAAPPDVDINLDFDQSVYVRSAINNVASRGGDRIVAGVADGPAVPRQLAQHHRRDHVDSARDFRRHPGAVLHRADHQSDDAWAACRWPPVFWSTTPRSRWKTFTAIGAWGSRLRSRSSMAPARWRCRARWLRSPSRIVFIPVAFLYGVSKYLFIPLALAVVFSLLASYCAFLHPGADAVPLSCWRTSTTASTGCRHGSIKLRENTLDGMRDGYGHVMEVVMRHRPFVLVCLLLIGVVSFFLARVVGTDFFPTADVGILKLHFRAPIGTRIEETEKIVLRVEEEIRKLIPAAELGTINDMVGVPLFFNLAFVPTDNISGMDADILISLKGDHKPSAYYQRVIREKIAADVSRARPCIFRTRISSRRC